MVLSVRLSPGTSLNLDLKQGNEKNKTDMITKIDYETSRDYKHLKELLDEGKDVIGFVTYDLHSRHRNEPDYKPFVVTDVCCFSLRDKGKEKCERYSFGVRGHCYYESFTDEYDFDFEKDCKALQVEYIEPKRLNVYQSVNAKLLKGALNWLLHNAEDCTERNFIAVWLSNTITDMEEGII